MRIKVFRFEQNGVPLFSAALRAEDLLASAKVDAWSPSNKDGYQRPLSARRIGELAWYLIQGEGLFPTSVLLSVRSEVEFREDAPVDGQVLGTLDIPEGEPLWVIDGQHRLAGVQGAIERGEQRLKDYQLPVVIFVNPDKLREIRWFYLVNNRAKNVPTDIADRILQRTYHEIGREALQAIESPQEKRAQKAVLQAKATDVVDYLMRKCPVWQDMIEVPGETKPSPYAVRQHTVVSSLLEGPFKDPTLARFEPDSVAELLDAYWCALREVFQDAFDSPGEYSIQKTPGLYALHMVFPDVFERCREVRDYSRAKIVELLNAIGIDSNFWHKDSERGDPRTFGTGMKSLRLLAEYLRDQLPPLVLAGM